MEFNYYCYTLFQIQKISLFDQNNLFCFLSVSAQSCRGTTRHGLLCLPPKPRSNSGVLWRYIETSSWGMHELKTIAVLLYLFMFSLNLFEALGIYKKVNKKAIKQWFLNLFFFKNQNVFKCPKQIIFNIAEEDHWCFGL